jgi:hypothetical protein
MTNIDQLREKFPNYKFVKESKDKYLVGIGHCLIPYDEELSLEIHDNINLIIDDCQSYDVDDNELIFKFSLFKLCTNLCDAWIIDEYDTIYPSSFKDLIKTYIVLNNMAKIFKGTYYNYNIELNCNLDFIVSFGVIKTKDLGVSYEVHETIVELKKFLDVNGKSDEDPEYETDCISYNFGKYCINIGLKGYEIDQQDIDPIFTIVAQEIINYVKEHSPELFVNKLAELHM